MFLRIFEDDRVSPLVWHEMRVSLGRWIITVVAIAATLIHAYRPSIFGDQSAVTIILLVFACLPWLGGVIRNVELPGGVKLEFRDLQEAKKEVEEAGLVPPLPKEAKGKRPDADGTLTVLKSSQITTRTWFLRVYELKSRVGFAN